MAGVAAVSTNVAGASANDLGWALSTVLRWFQRNAADAVADLPGGPRGYSVLHVVASGQCRNQAEIADFLGIDRTVFTYLLDEFQELGLVERRPDQRDRRARQIVATERGLALLDGLRTRIDAVQEDMLASLGGHDAEVFVGLLDRLAERATSAGHDGGGSQPVRER